MIETIEVTKRDAVGSWAVRKLRGQGLVPAILYGHGEENICLAVKRETVAGLIRHGSRVVSLTGAINETALLRDVQWDTFGSDVIHLDFARVSNTERVEVTLPVHIHGEANGGAGAQLIVVTHEVTIECPAASVPEHISVDISGLKRDSAIHVSDLKLADDMVAITPANIVIVHFESSTTAEDLQPAGGPAEPELIGGAKSEGKEAE